MSAQRPKVMRRPLNAGNAGYRVRMHAAIVIAAAIGARPCAAAPGGEARAERALVRAPASRDHRSPRRAAMEGNAMNLTLGMIGLGRMGGNMSRRLARAGHTVMPGIARPRLERRLRTSRLRPTRWRHSWRACHRRGSSG